VAAPVVLAADVGGTKTNLALVQADATARVGPASLRVLAAATYPSASFPSLEALLDAFRTSEGSAGPALSAATIGFAGAVANGRGYGSNLPWAADAASLARHLGLPRVGLLNDLVAAGHGIATLRPEQVTSLLPGTAAEGNAAIIAAGTGLGETILARVGEDYVPIPSEGGHADFAPRTDLELQIWHALRARHGRVSVERVLSGPGLANVAEVTHERAGAAAAAAWKEHVAEANGESAMPAIISTSALSERCAACAQAVEVFAGAYGSEAGNLALRCVALGGIYVAGGIAPQILPALRSPAFESAFRDKEPHHALLAAIPVTVVLDDKLPLWGAARHAALSLQGEA
jgi:glucokinase